jgi:hypothetical protein
MVNLKVVSYRDSVVRVGKFTKVSVRLTGGPVDVQTGNRDVILDQ